MKRRFLKLCCWTKDTILAASPRPFQIHPDALDPAEFLPPTECIVWMWRKKKRSRKALVRASGDAEDSSESSPHSRRGFMRGNSRCFWMPSRGVLGKNNETIHQGVARRGQEGPQRDRRNGQTVRKALELSCRKKKKKCALLYKKSSPKKKP